ncbi:polysaccharide deacetylase family protein [Desulfovibrio sp. OttesenSCG-928-O18]|nr:polysaccharide deacetylase family protein [Desulfovibrio sp. OttesenSCG-928-O18]
MRRAVLAFIFVLFPLTALAGTEPSVADLGAQMTEKYRHEQPRFWGESLPGIVTRLETGAETPPTEDADKKPRMVALTLDACEGGTDTRIIALLRKHAVPAAIFITNRWLRGNAGVARELAADPLFTLACHGKRHKPASINGRAAYGIRGTASITALVDEVETNARAVAAITGERPQWYRSGTAFYDDVALKIIHDLGLGVAGYTVSADAGATLGAKEVARRMRAAKDGSIILCHLNHPESGTAEGLARAIPAMLENGVIFTPLERKTP